MRTVAQFNIRDDAGMEPSVEPHPHRASVGSLRSASGQQLAAAAGASSLRNMEHAPQILEQEELGHQMDRMATLPEGYATGYDRSSGSGSGGGAGPSDRSQQLDPYYGGGGDDGQNRRLSMAPQIRLPGGGDGMMPMYGGDNGEGGWGGPDTPQQGNYGQYEQYGQYGGHPQSGGGYQQQQGGGPPMQLPPQEGSMDEDEWTREAIAHMNLAGQMPPPQQRAD